MQYDLYASYVSRFTFSRTSTNATKGSNPPTADINTASTTNPVPAQSQEVTPAQAETTPQQGSADVSSDQNNPNRFLTAVQFLDLLQMAFPGASPAKDEEGNFVVKGLMKRS